MKWKSSTYVICLLVVAGFIACGGDSDDDADKQPTKPATSTSGGEAIKIIVDFEAEEAAIREVFTLHAEAIETKDPDEFMQYWLKSKSEDVFAAWDFWAGAFEKHLGWEGVKTGWVGIFRIRSGKMTVEFESVAIDKTGKNASLRGRYQWAVSGGLIALMVKDRKEGWKIKQADYTNGKFGKQVDELKDPAYVNPPPDDEQK
ncbi:hypothetical protein J4G02_16640 [Candidatus Poribacteria bacterium]|nr:hypothetical protein [Candidatus Poribacteria bacterium]